jgi:hypothetical protein
VYMVHRGNPAWEPRAPRPLFVTIGRPELTLVVHSRYTRGNSRYTRGTLAVGSRGRVSSGCADKESPTQRTRIAKPRATNASGSPRRRSRWMSNSSECARHVRAVTCALQLLRGGRGRSGLWEEDHRRV